MAREIGDPWLDAFVMLRHSMIELGESRWNDGQSVLDEATSVAEYQGDELGHNLFAVAWATLALHAMQALRQAPSLSHSVPTACRAP